MKQKSHNMLATICVLAMLVAISAVFVMYFTFADDPVPPKRTATYKPYELTWDTHTEKENETKLNIFGEVPEGETALIHPLLKDEEYKIRIDNQDNNEIEYSIYLYCKNKDNVPLQFEIKDAETIGIVAINETDYDLFDTELKSEKLAVNDQTLLNAYKGKIDGKKHQDLIIKWGWNTNTDENDTAFGNEAVGRDITYDFYLKINIDRYTIYRSSSKTLTHKPYVVGRDGGYFFPEASITRAEAATIFARIMSGYDESKLKNTNTGFKDVPSNEWYAKYVSYLEDKNIIFGYDGYFRPNDNITRAEFAAICVRYVEKTMGTELKPTDIDFSDFDSSHWAYDTVRKAVRKEYIKGYPDETFKPDNHITRAESVSLVNRILERYPDKSYIDKNISKFTQYADVMDNEYWAYYDIYEASTNHKHNKSTKKWTGLSK